MVEISNIRKSFIFFLFGLVAFFGVRVAVPFSMIVTVLFYLVTCLCFYLMITYAKKQEEIEDEY